MPDLVVSDIIGGHQPLKRDIGANITIQHISDAYRRYPAFKDIHELKVKAIWSNGLTEDVITPEAIIEMKDTHLWDYLYGYSVAILDATQDPIKIEGMHPMVDGIGFHYTKFSPKGYPMEIQVMLTASEVEAELIQFKVPAYPCEKDNKGEYIRSKPIPSKYGFISLRTRGGIKGVRGYPLCLELLDAVRAQYDILRAYVPYAEKQGMAFPTIGLEHNTKTSRASIISQFANQPTTNRLLMIGKEDWIEWISPQSDAYDPFPILEWINGMIARSSQMNKLMLEGDPSGYLSASETAISNWEASVKEDQIFEAIQFNPIFQVLGATNECTFKDPSKPTFISLMEGLEHARLAMEGIVAKEDIVRIMNEYLEKHGHKEELKVAPDEEQEGFEDKETKEDKSK